MSAEMLWLYWQAMGTPVPMVVCETLVYLAHFYVDEESDENTGDVGVSDGYGYVGPLDKTMFAVVRGYQPMPLTAAMVDLLKQWVWSVASGNNECSWTAKVHRMDNDPETCAWAGER